MRFYPYLIWILLFNAIYACSDTVIYAEKPGAEKVNRPSSYLINCEKQCDQVASQIRAAGGHVRQRYANFDIISFDLADSAAKNVLAQYDVVKDKQIKAPIPVEKHQFPRNKLLLNNGIKSLANEKLLPNSYLSSNRQTGAAAAHAENILGDGVIVAIIDSGTANNSTLVPLIADSVIGGESFVNDDLEPSATSTKNDSHGTWVGTMIAGHGSVLIDKTDTLATSLAIHSPADFIEASESQIEIPVVGTSPSASLYPLKVFDAAGSGASSSTVIAAMDRVLTLKTNFDQGIPSEPVAGDGSEDNPFVYDSLNIQVVNMSLGGPSLFPGHEIDDVLTDKMLDAGIVVVVSAGNEGFAAMTGGSPGTGIGAIAVGASNDAIHERVFRDVTLGEGVGVEFRPTTFPQIASFSSRGPTADGRNGIDLVANGRAVYTQGANGDMDLVSGTSFSAPTVSGAAALLWSAYPDAGAKQIKAALVEGAKSDYFLPGTSVYDQGHGLLDINESLKILEKGVLVDHLPKEPKAEPNTKVADNIGALGIPVFSLNENVYETDITLIPGQVHQIFVETDKNTHDVIVSVDEFVAQLPEENQNSIFGDEFILTVADAQLSTDHIILDELVKKPETFIVSHPQPGLVRVAFLGDWTNAGLVSAKISVRRVNEQPLMPILTGTIADGETKVFKFNVDPAVEFVSFGLSWINDWSYYPSHDLDIIVIDPNGNSNFRGASLHSPEFVGIEAPTPGVWTVKVDGFLLHEFSEDYQLSVNDQNGDPILLVYQ